MVRIGIVPSSNLDDVIPRKDPSGLRGLGLFAIFLGIGGIGTGALALLVVFAQRLMFSTVFEDAPDFPPDGVQFMEFMDGLHRELLIHAPIWMLGGVLFLVLGIFMRSSDARRAAAARASLVVSAIAGLELAWFSWRSYVWQSHNPALKIIEEMPEPPPFDFAGLAAAGSIVNGVMFVAPVVVFAALVLRALRREVTTA